MQTGLTGLIAHIGQLLSMHYLNDDTDNELDDTVVFYDNGAAYQ